ncbi:N-6 DNA methylase [Chloroflexota bacterium]
MTVIEVYNQVKNGLEIIGYRDGLQKEDYVFADILGPAYSLCTVSLAAFAQEPPSYRNACFGVVRANGLSGESLVSQYRSLGAPQIIEIVDHGLRRWRMTSFGTPKFLEHVETENISGLFETHKDDWSPERILRAKSIGNKDLEGQLDFFDTGLIPLIDSQVQTKLDLLLRRTVALTMKEYQQRNPDEALDHARLVRLLFRLIAAKLLGDRKHPGNWLEDDPQKVIKSVQDFYFKEPVSTFVLADEAVQRVAWSNIKSAFHFQNLSVEALAYVYENTFVTGELRKKYGIHSTPPQIAEYIVRQIPFEQIDQEKRFVFEPFAGHAVFLVATMRRLRELMPVSMGPKERHEYFIQRLSGIEKDDFAREVGRLSLMLADYPNPDGWRLLGGDVFLDQRVDTEISKADVVLCNPPFEDFTSEQRQAYANIKSVHKPGEILRRVCENPNRPRFLGFVLPRSFISGVHYNPLRALISSYYHQLELVALPDRVFRHSDAEAVLLIASNKKDGSNIHIVAKEVLPRDLPKFLTQGIASTSHERQISAEVISADPQLWEPSLSQVWEYFGHHDRFGSIAEVHRGIEYNINVRENRVKLVSKSPLAGFSKGLDTVGENVEPYIIRDTVFLNMSQELMRTNAHELPWARPNVIANAHRLSRGPWRITAVPNEDGLVCYHNFHGIWPIGGVRLEVIAAILNSPIANAYLATHERVDNRKTSVESIPIPSLGDAEAETLTNLVRSYIELKNKWKMRILGNDDAKEGWRRLIMQIDAVLLKAYDLPPKLERQLLDFFEGSKRPGDPEFTEYYPKGFQPYIPWHIYISREFQLAKATATVSRIPILKDPGISAALAELE